MKENSFSQKKANKNYETQRKFSELIFLSVQIICKLSFEHRRRHMPFSDFVLDPFW